MDNFSLWLVFLRHLCLKEQSAVGLLMGRWSQVNRTGQPRMGDARSWCPSENHPQPRPHPWGCSCPCWPCSHLPPDQISPSIPARAALGLHSLSLLPPRPPSCVMGLLPLHWRLAPVSMGTGPLRVPSDAHQCLSSLCSTKVRPGDTQHRWCVWGSHCP